MYIDIFQAVYNELSKCFQTNRKDIFLTVLLPGLAVDSSLNIAGSREFDNISLFCDNAPKVSAVYTPSGYRISREYGNALNANLPESKPLTGDKRKLLDKAYEYINKNFKQYNDFKYSIDVLTADYNKLRMSKDNKGIEKAAEYQEEIKRLRRLGNDIITIYEQHKNIIMELSATNGPANYFRQAQILFRNLLNNGLPDVRFVPDSWAAEPDKLAWTEINVAVSDENEGFKGVLQFQAARVMLLRDWLDYSIFSFKDISMEGCEKSYLSNGTLKDTDKCRLPIVPTSIILTKNVKAYVELYAENNENVLGPFIVPNKTHMTDEEKKHYKGYFALSAESMQITALINNVVPAFPR